MADLKQLPALVRKTTGTRGRPLLSTSLRKACRAAGRAWLPRTSTPSTSKRNPKAGGCKVSAGDGHRRREPFPLPTRPAAPFPARGKDAGGGPDPRCRRRSPGPRRSPCGRAGPAAPRRAAAPGRPAGSRPAPCRSRPATARGRGTPGLVVPGLQLPARRGARRGGTGAGRWSGSAEVCTPAPRAGRRGAARGRRERCCWLAGMRCPFCFGAKGYGFGESWERDWGRRVDGKAGVGDSREAGGEAGTNSPAMGQAYKITNEEKSWQEGSDRRKPMRISYTRPGRGLSNLFPKSRNRAHKPICHSSALGFVSEAAPVPYSPVLTIQRHLPGYSLVSV